jgi:hypothetical protein
VVAGVVLFLVNTTGQRLKAAMLGATQLVPLRYSASNMQRMWSIMRVCMGFKLCQTRTRFLCPWEVADLTVLCGL